MYGKLENGKFKKAKHFIIDGNATIINPTDEMYARCGYKKVVSDEMPIISDGMSLRFYYTETNDTIIKHYEVVRVEAEV